MTSWLSLFPSLSNSFLPPTTSLCDKTVAEVLALLSSLWAFLSIYHGAVCVISPHLHPMVWCQGCLWMGLCPTGLGSAPSLFPTERRGKGTVDHRPRTL